MFFMLLPLVGYLYGISGEHTEINPDLLVGFITGFDFVKSIVIFMVSKATF